MSRAEVHNLETEVRSLNTQYNILKAKYELLQEKTEAANTERNATELITEAIKLVDRDGAHAQLGHEVSKRYAPNDPAADEIYNVVLFFAAVSSELDTVLKRFKLYQYT
jgi:hypothetical protein